jgi:MFS family permease
MIRYVISSNLRDKMLTASSPLASSMVAPAIPRTMEDLHITSDLLGSLTISVFLVGYIIGPLFFAPLSEIYGRYWIVNFANSFMTVWLVGCALAPDTAGLIVMRILAGTGGSAIMVIAPAIAADMYPVEKRVFATSTIVLAQCAGPARE